MRILVTGSRNYKDITKVSEVLSSYEGTHTLVHGGAKGLDDLANQVATALGWKTEVFPADWKNQGKAAGPLRNQQMVNTNPDICIAFPLEGSRGTWDCVKRAKNSNIPIRVIT